MASLAASLSNVGRRLKARSPVLTRGMSGTIAPKVRLVLFDVFGKSRLGTMAHRDQIRSVHLETLYIYSQSHEVK
jgi:hypothetical protein